MMGTEEAATDLRRQAVHLLAPLQRDLDRALDVFGRALGAIDVFEGTPMDCSETADAVEFSFDVPGYDAEDLDVSVSGEVLTVVGRGAPRPDSSVRRYRVTERREGPFRRSAPLPCGADVGAIEASLKAGVLQVVVPRAPDAVARNIPIRVVSPTEAP